MEYARIFKFNKSHAADGRFTSHGNAGKAFAPSKKFNPVDTSKSGALAAFDKHHEDHLKTLTPDELKDVRKYTGYGYEQLNIGLREGAKLNSDHQKMAQALDKATSSKLGSDMVLHRVIYKPEVLKAMSSMKAGDAFIEKGFMSTTHDVSVAHRFRKGGGASETVYMSVRAKASDHGSSLRTASSSPKENEVLLPRGSKLVFHHVEETKEGKTFWFDIGK